MKRRRSRPGFPVNAQSSILDYDYANISGQPFLLPLRADERMKTARLQFKNVVEFHDYRKFTGESTISFDVPGRPRTLPRLRKRTASVRGH